MDITAGQWKLILEAEDVCIRCFAHQPELSHDIVPMVEPLAQLQIEWYLRSVSVYHD